MHERHAGQMRMHDLVHLGVGPDLQERRQVLLDLGERPARRDFEHQRGIAKQRAVLDGRDIGVLRALDEFEPDCPAIKSGAEEILNVAHQRREGRLEIVVFVGGIIARAPLLRGEGCEFSGEAQELHIETLGMHVARAAIVLERRDLAVQQLEHQIVGALQSATGGGVAGVAGKFVELGAYPADHAVEPAFDRGMGGGDEQRRGEFLVEHDRAVMHLDDARDGKSDISGLGGLAHLKGETWIGDLDLLLDAQMRRGIDDGLDPADVSGGILGLLGAHLARILRAGRHRQPYELSGRCFRHVDRRRGGAFRREIEQPAVRHDAGADAKAELGLLRQIPIDFERGEAPGIGRRIAGSVLNRRLEIAVRLLQMMRSQEEAFGPVNFCVPRH